MTGLLAPFERLESLVRRAFNLAASAFAGNVGPNVANISALTTYGAGLNNGVVGWVETVKDSWTHQQNAPGLVIDDITVAASSYGPNARWVRSETPNELWVVQTTWFIDWIFGNDENIGSAVAPIKTLKEFKRRRQGHFGIRVIDSVLDIHFLSYPDPDDPIRLDFDLYEPDAFGGGPVVTLYAPPLQTLSSGVFTGVTPRDRAQNTPWSVQDGVVNTAADTWRRIRITEGPRAGASTFVARSTGLGARRTGEWAIWDVVNNSTRVTPQPGDAYDVEIASGVAHYDYVRILAGDSLVWPNQPRVTFVDWDFRTATQASAWAENRNAQVTFQNCRFSQFDNIQIATPEAGPQSFTYFQNCCFDQTCGELRFVAGSWSQNFVDGGVYVNAIAGMIGSGATLDMDVLLDADAGIAGSIIAYGASTMVIATAGVMDTKTDGVQAQDGGVVIVADSQFYGTQGFVWGTSATANTVGAGIKDCGRMRVRTPGNCTITGAAGNIRLGDSLNGLPFAGVAYGAAVPATWAALAANGSLANVVQDAQIHVSSAGVFP